MNRLPLAKRCQIIQLLVEGNSLRACSRIADVSINTVTRILVEVGRACYRFHNENIVNLHCNRIQCDEIWSFVYAKKKTKLDRSEYHGDAWTFTAIDPDTKLIVSYHVGPRIQKTANEFMDDLWRRLKYPPELTTDGYRGYQEAVADSFGGNVHYTQLIKKYDSRDRYIGADKIVVSGKPDIKRATTAHVERQNLTMRMSMRRFTRETNGFSKKVENHCYAIALNFMYYNFARIHKTLRVTPAMEARLTKKPWKIQDIVLLSNEY